MGNRNHRVTFTEAEVRAVVRALDIALTVSKKTPHGRSVSYRPLGSPFPGPDRAETAAARRAFKHLLALRDDIERDGQEDADG